MVDRLPYHQPGGRVRHILDACFHHAIYRKRRRDLALLVSWWDHDFMVSIRERIRFDCLNVTDRPSSF